MARNTTHRHDVQPLGDLAETLGRLLRNTVFRLSLIGALLFGFSLLIAQLFAYDRVITSEIRRVETTLLAEFRSLDQLGQREGENAVRRAQAAGIIPPNSVPYTPEQTFQAQAIADTAASGNIYGALLARDIPPDNYSLFVFKGATAGDFRTRDIVENGLASKDLDRYRDRGRDAFKEFLVIQTTNPATDETEDRRILTVGKTFGSEEDWGGVLVIGRDVENILRTGERMREAMLISSLIALFLGILSATFVARRFAKRVDDFNKLATDVQAGNLDRRATRNYSEDEMDTLAEHLNGMLDHIDRLMQAMRYAGDSVAHDLRTPLTRLRTRLETAAVEAGDTPEADTLWAAAGDADELLGTFDSVLRIARLEAGERRELLKPLDPKPVLDDLAELYEPACEDVGLMFTHDIEEGLLILADRGLLSQAVSNLVENAIKYAGNGGGTRIHLQACRGAKGRTRISVSDDGPGIPMFERERVKERFVRLDKSRTLPGSGLGLALVDAVAELHGAEFIMDDGLGADAMAEGDEDAAQQPGLRVELVFPRVRAVRKAEEVAQAAE